MEIPEGKEKGTESIFKIIMAENFLNLGREMDNGIWLNPTRLNPNRVIPRHIITIKSKGQKEF